MPRKSQVVGLVMRHGFVVTAVGLLAGLSLANLVPALRAARVDPISALRVE